MEYPKYARHNMRNLIAQYLSQAFHSLMNEVTSDGGLNGAILEQASCDTIKADFAIPGRVERVRRIVNRRGSWRAARIETLISILLVFEMISGQWKVDGWSIMRMEGGLRLGNSKIYHLVLFLVLVFRALQTVRSMPIEWKWRWPTAYRRNEAPTATTNLYPYYDGMYKGI